MDGYMKRYFLIEIEEILYCKFMRFGVNARIYETLFINRN